MCTTYPSSPPRVSCVPCVFACSKKVFLSVSSTVLSRATIHKAPCYGKSLPLYLEGLFAPVFRSNTDAAPHCPKLVCPPCWQHTTHHVASPRPDPNPPRLRVRRGGGGGHGSNQEALGHPPCPGLVRMHRQTLLLGCQGATARSSRK